MGASVARRLAGIVVATSVALGALAVPGAAQDAPPDTTLPPDPSAPADPAVPPRSLESVTQDLVDARAKADEALARYLEAWEEKVRLDDELATVRTSLPRVRALHAALRDRVRARAVELYKTSDQAGALGILRSKSIDDAATKAQLTRTIAANDAELVSVLTTLADQVAELEETLVAKERRQREVLELVELHRASMERELFRTAVVWFQLQAFAEKGGPTEGLEAERAIGDVLTGATRCPVAGPLAFTNDWGNPRSGGRTHEGTDIFGAHGTPNVAVVDGVIRQRVGGLDGTAVWLDGIDGVSYYYAHLSGFEGPERFVRAGEIIGYLGDTGNAAGGAPHTHFQLHPGGATAEPVNPYLTLRALCGDGTTPLPTSTPPAP